MITEFESPIEKLFYEAVHPRVLPSVVIEPQASFGNTDGKGKSWTHSRVDFLFCTNGKRWTVVECDGKDFHNYEKDRLRDARLIFGNGIDEVVRFRGRDIVYGIDECIQFLGSSCPFLFIEDAPEIDVNSLYLWDITLNKRSFSPIYRRRSPRNREAMLEVGSRYMKKPRDGPVEGLDINFPNGISGMCR